MPPNSAGATFATTSCSSALALASSSGGYGAALDRLLDQRHAGLVERSIVVQRSYGWRCETEVTFSEYGERG